MVSRSGQATAATFTGASPQGAVTTANLVARWAATDGARVALADGTREISYAALDAAANRIAWALAGVKAVRGGIVPLCLPPSLDLVVAAMGVQRAGLAFAYSDPRLGPKGLRDRLAHAEARCAIGNAATLPLLREVGGPDMALLDGPGAADDAALRADHPGIHPEPGDLAYLRYTSGSTGTPKGVMYSHRTAVGSGFWLRDISMVRAEDRICIAENFWAAIVLGALQIGATLHMAPLGHGGLRGLAHVTSRHGVTVLASFPTAFREFVTALEELHAEGAGVPLPRLHSVLLSGEPITRDDVVRARRVLAPGCRLVNGYGSSELANIAVCVVPDPLPPGGVPAGRAMGDTEIVLLNADGTPAGPGDAGEVAVRTPFMVSGYWRRPALTREVFGTDDPTEPGTLYRTGDVGRIDAEGVLWLVGRVDNQIKLRGHRILPEEIEAVLREHPSVADAAVRAFEDPRGGTLRLAALVVGCASEAEQRALRAWAHERLPDYMVPRLYVPLDALPRTAAGKLDRRALPDPASIATRAALGPGAAVASASAASREAVARAWRGALDAASLAADQPFDEAGGDSLRLLHLVLLLERFAGREIPLECVHPAMRPSEMAAALDSPAAGSGLAGAHGTTVFMLPGLAGDEPALAALRAACAPALRFHLVRWPEAAALRHAPGRGGRLCEAVLAQVAAAAPEGPLGLVGYSFGGNVAHASAHRLVAAGRVVRFACLLDCPAPTMLESRLPDTSLRRLYWDLRHIVAGRDPGLGKANRLALQVLSRMPSDSRLLHAALARGWPGAAELLRVRLRLQLAERLRMSALLAWLAEDAASGAEQLAVPVTLMRAADGTPSPDDLGWGSFCARLSVLPVEGNHYSMLGPAARRALAEALLRVAAA